VARLKGQEEGEKKKQNGRAGRGEKEQKQHKREHIRGWKSKGHLLGRRRRGGVW